MKVINKVCIVFLMIICVASCSKVNKGNMTVIKDCTGSYLRFNEKDYRICNIEAVADYESGTEVQASFREIETCSDSDVIVCAMLHENEGWVKVGKIK